MPNDTDWWNAAGDNLTRAYHNLVGITEYPEEYDTKDAIADVENIIVDLQEAKSILVKYLNS